MRVTTTSDDEGRYAFRDLIPGMDYTVSATGFTYTFAPPMHAFVASQWARC